MSFRQLYGEVVRFSSTSIPKTSHKSILVVEGVSGLDLEVIDDDQASQEEVVLQFVEKTQWW